MHDCMNHVHLWVGMEDAHQHQSRIGYLSSIPFVLAFFVTSRESRRSGGAAAAGGGFGLLAFAQANPFAFRKSKSRPSMLPTVKATSTLYVVRNGCTLWRRIMSEGERGWIVCIVRRLEKYVAA